MSHRSAPSSPKIHVVAPAGPVPADRLRAGMAAARRLGPAQWALAENLPQRTGYFAGDDAARLAGLLTALRDPDASAVWCARGGYGSTRLLAALDRDAPAGLPTLVGFSDVTALLCWAWSRRGCRGVHGPVVAQLGSLPPHDAQRVWDILHATLPPPLETEAEESCVVHGGTVEGPLIIGNLEVLRSLVGTPYVPSLEGCILALEDVGERPYRIDRSLTQLQSAGVLRGVRGIAIGQFTGCVEPEGTLSAGPSAMDVLLERLEPLGVPVVTGFPFGHDPARNAAMIFGAPTRLDAAHGTLSQLEPLG